PPRVSVPPTFYPPRPPREPPRRSRGPDLDSTVPPSARRHRPSAEGRGQRGEDLPDRRAAWAGPSGRPDFIGQAVVQASPPGPRWTVAHWPKFSSTERRNASGSGRPREAKASRSREARWSAIS